MALLLLIFWAISIATTWISFLLMLNGKSFYNICLSLILEIRISKGFHLEETAKICVEHKVKKLKLYLYMISLVPVLNIVYVWVVKASVKSGYIKTILKENY